MLKNLNILKMFFEEPNREFNVREVARITNLSPPKISKESKNLAKIGILLERKERIFNLYKANLDDDLYKDLKIFYTIRQLKESGLIDSLNKFYLKPTLSLFGSSASGIDIENSDLDLLVVSENIKEFKDVKKFENKLKRNIHIFNVKDIKDLKNKGLINNVLNGIVIQGKIKWI